VLDRFDLARISEDRHRTLPDGTHTLHLIATDVKATRSGAMSVRWTRVPRSATLDLARRRIRRRSAITARRSTWSLVGRTSPGALVALVGTEAATTADQTGHFAFEDVALAVGRNYFTVSATDLAGNKSFGSVLIKRVTAPLPTLAIGDVTVAEGNNGTTSAVMTVSLSSASAQPVTVDFATANNTATAPADCTGQTGTLTFAPA
jgi:hypothetical protein